jgi:hypothetical protein
MLVGESFGNNDRAQRSQELDRESRRLAFDPRARAPKREWVVWYSWQCLGMDE